MNMCHKSNLHRKKWNKDHNSDIPPGFGSSFSFGQITILQGQDQEVFYKNAYGNDGQPLPFVQQGEIHLKPEWVDPF